MQEGEDHHYVLVVNASNMQKDWDWIQKNNTFDAKLEDISDHMSLLAVQVYQDNELLQEIHSKKGKFTLNLDLDNTYTFVLNQEGYRPKSVFIDTHVPVKQVQYSEYACYMNLEAADKFTHSDPFYMDFPGAIVLWNDESHGFMPSMGYLTDIQSKIGMLEAQMIPH